MYINIWLAWSLVTQEIGARILEDPKAFSLHDNEVIWLGELLRAILHCMEYVRFMPGSAPKDKRGNSVVTRPYTEILTASLLG